MNDSSAAHGYFAPWDPKELGLPKAAAAAIFIVVLIAAIFIAGTVVLTPKPQLQVIQITQAQPVTLPTPPPPPKVVPPPKPLPAVIPKPPPVPSRIVVATKPPPPVHHVYRPIAHPVINPPPMPAARPAPPPAAPVVPTSGIPVYGNAMHATLEANHDVPQALAALGISGTATVQITVAPDGHVIAAKLMQSSGNPLIDQTALAHAREAVFAPFTADMPANPLTFTVPVDIEPGAADDDSSGD